MKLTSPAYRRQILHSLRLKSIPILPYPVGRLIPLVLLGLLVPGQAASAAALDWVGTNPIWDVGVTVNWVSNGIPTTFANGDSVVFDDTATGFNVTGTNLQPGSVVFNNSANDYTITGTANTIGGAAAVTMTGAGTVSFAGTNQFSGGLNVLNGTVSSGTSSNANAQPFGNGTITLGDSSGSASATLQCALGGTLANPITIAAGSAGTLTLQDPGNPLVFGGNLALNNNLTVDNEDATTNMVFSGTLTETSLGSPALAITCPFGGANFSGPVVLGTGGLTFVNAITLSQNYQCGIGPGNITSATTGSLTLENNNIYSYTAGFAVSAASINFSGNLTNTGSGYGAAVISGNIGGNVGEVVQDSPNSVLTLTGSNSFSGGLYILNGTASSGTAANQNAFPFGAGNVIVGDTSGNNNATLQCAMSALFSNNIIVPAGSSGTLTIQDANNYPTNAGSVALNNNLTVYSPNSGKFLTFLGLVTETSSNSPNLTLTCPYGGVYFSGGLVVGSGGLNLANDASGAFVVGPGSAYGPGSITGTGSLTNLGTGTGTVALKGSIGGGIGTIVQDSPTSPLVLSGTNSFSGGLVILSGLAAGSNNFSYGTGPITLGASSGGANATLQNYAAAGSYTTITNAIIVAAGSSGTLSILGNNNYTTNSGNLTLDNNLTASSLNSGKALVFSGLTTENSSGLPGLTISSPALGTSLAGPPTFSGGVVVDAGGLTFADNTAGGTFIVGPGAITGGGPVTFEANSNSLMTISATNINMAGTLTNAGTGSATTTISGNIGGNVQSVAQNSATSQLSLSGSNSFSGGLYILNGTVASTANNAFVFGAGTITLGDSSGANSATLKNGNGAGAISTIPNPIVVAAGSSGILSIQGNNNTTTNGGNLTLDNNLSVSNGNTAKIVFSGLATETSAGSPTLTISTLGGTNSVGPITFSGGVVVGSGGLTFANYNPAGTFTVGPGAITSTTTGSLTFDANSNSVFVVSAASINPSGSLTNAGTGAGTTTISGNLGSNVTSVVENSATSALVLSGTNVNSVTLVALGTLGLAGGSLSNSPVTVGPGGTNNVAASTAIAGLNDVGGLGGVVLNNVNNTNNTLTLVGSGAYSFNGSVENGTNGAATMLSLTLSGSGVQALGGANSYSGPTTVTAGTLLVNGNSSGVTNAFMVGAGGSLGGVGTIGGAVTFAAGSAAVLTNGAVLTLTNSLTIAASGTLPVVALNLSNNVAVGDYTLATYNPAGSSGAFNSAPVLLSGSFAANTTASITTGGGAVVLSVTSASTDNNASLASLVLAPGGALTPAFATNVYSYSATNAYTSNPVTVTASSADPQATMTLSLNGTLVGPLTNGVASGALVLSLNPPTNTVVVTVISPDLSVTNPYTVNVLLQPSQTVPALVSARNGTSLVLSWPADHLGYRLLVQTNNLQGGISRNPGDWGTVPGSTTVTTTNLTVSRTNLDEYYRLAYP